MPTDKEIQNWLKRMKRAIEAFPDGTEAHLSYGSITIYESGRMSQHMGTIDDGYGISDGSELGCVLFDTGKLIPYSEGT